MIVDFLSVLHSSLDGTTLLLFSVVAYLSWKFLQCRNLPPGPWGLPIVGYLPFMGKNPPEEKLNELAKKYGDIMSIFLGSELAVVLNSYDAIKEAFLKQADNFAGRPTGNFFKIRDEDKGVATSDGEPWKEHRRFILSTFRDFGMGKLSLEPRVSEEVNCFLELLAKQRGKPFDLTTILGMSTANIISTLEFGKRFDYNDGRFVRLRKLQDTIVDDFANLPVRAVFPWLRYLPFTEGITMNQKLIKGQEELLSFTGDLTEEHKAEYEENSRKDLIDSYLTERNEMIRKTGDEGHFNGEELKGTLLSLFGAGTETTTSTLRWGFLLMLNYPDIQKKVHEEIDRVIGMERSPSVTDRNEMVYTEAVLMEIQRFGSIIPLNLPHANLEATELKGYRIPKRALIISNLWAVHFDPKLWDHPEKFTPERFIGQNGKLQKSEYLIPFGIGKRACLGESLARMELFLYFTSCLQRFELKPPPGITPNLAYESGFARRPKHYELCALQRKGYAAA